MLSIALYNAAPERYDRHHPTQGLAIPDKGPIRRRALHGVFDIFQECATPRFGRKARDKQEKQS
jgi:hypothetical protein